MRARFLLGSAVVSLAACLSGGCGGAGGGSTSSSLAIPASPGVDGWVREDGVLDASNPFGIECGDSWDHHSYRGFLRFPLDGIPAGKAIKSAHLSAYQWLTSGDPFTLFGDLLVDHMNIGLGLSAADYDTLAFTANIGALSTSNVQGTKVLDVTTSVRADLLAGRTRSDFRLRFALATNGDVLSDYVAFNDAEGNQGPVVPLLTIVWDD